MDEILTEIVRQCVEKGIIKGTTLAVDSTHTSANCKKQVPERIMKHLAAKLFAALEADHDGKLPDGIDAAGFSSYDGEFRLPLQLAKGSPVFIRIAS